MDSTEGNENTETAKELTCLEKLKKMPFPLKAYFSSVFVIFICSISIFTAKQFGLVSDEVANSWFQIQGILLLLVISVYFKYQPYSTHGKIIIIAVSSDFFKLLYVVAFNKITPSLSDYLEGKKFPSIWWSNYQNTYKNGSSKALKQDFSCWPFL